jgi:hypothetical protein
MAALRPFWVWVGGGAWRLVGGWGAVLSALFWLISLAQHLDRSWVIGSVIGFCFCLFITLLSAALHAVQQRHSRSEAVGLVGSPDTYGEIRRLLDSLRDKPPTNAADYQMYSALLTAQATIEQAVARFRSDPTAKVALNKAISNFNTAIDSYKAYHGAVTSGIAQDPSAVQTLVNAAVSAVAALETLSRSPAPPTPAPAVQLPQGPISAPASQPRSLASVIPHLSRYQQEFLHQLAKQGAITEALSPELMELQGNNLIESVFQPANSPFVSMYMLSPAVEDDVRAYFSEPPAPPSADPPKAHLAEHPNLTVEFPEDRYAVRMKISNSGGIAKRLDIKVDSTESADPIFRVTQDLTDSGGSLTSGSSHTFLVASVGVRQGDVITEWRFMLGGHERRIDFSDTIPSRRELSIWISVTCDPVNRSGPIRWRLTFDRGGFKTEQVTPPLAPPPVGQPSSTASG